MGKLKYCGSFVDVTVVVVAYTMNVDEFGISSLLVVALIARVIQQKAAYTLKCYNCTVESLKTFY